MDRDRRKRLAQAAAVFASAALGTARAAEQRALADREPILLGQSVPLSGPAGRLGAEYRDGARLYFDQVNAGGGIAGHEIRLMSLDDEYSTDRTIENTKKLIADGVFAFFGQFGTAHTLASLPLTSDRGIPLFAPFTGADSVRRNASRYFFHVRASYSQEMKHIVDHLHTIGVTKVAVLYQADPFGRSGLDGVVAAMREHSAEPIVTGEIEIFPKINVDDAVAKIANSAPAAVILATSGPGATQFIKRYAQTSQSAQFYGMSVVSSSELVSELGPRSRGIVISQIVPSPWSTRAAISADYMRAKKASKDSTSPTYVSLEGYIAARIFCEGLRRAGGSISRETLVLGLESLRDFDLGGFRITYGKGQRSGSRYVELTMLSADGLFVR